MSTKPPPTSKKFIKICPNCGSANISINANILALYGSSLTDICKDCNHGYPNGQLFPEIEESKIESFKKSISLKKKK